MITVRDQHGNRAASSFVDACRRNASQDRQRQRGLALGFGKFTGAVATVAMLVYFATVSGLEGTSQPVQDQILFASVEPTAQPEQATVTNTTKPRKSKVVQSSQPSVAMTIDPIKLKNVSTIMLLANSAEMEGTIVSSYYYVSEAVRGAGEENTPFYIGFEPLSVKPWWETWLEKNAPKSKNKDGRPK